MNERKITDYFVTAPVERNSERLNFKDTREMSNFRKLGKTAKSLNESVRNNCLAGISWDNIHTKRKNQQMEQARELKEKIERGEVPDSKKAIISSLEQM